MYGSREDIQHNLKMFFIDGVSFMPSMALISVTAVIPFFLDQLGATTFQIGLAPSIAFVCGLLTQPIFGVVASKSTVMHKTFGKILLLQRVIFLTFVLLIPVLSRSNSLLILCFLVFWGVFNLFVGSYSVFHTPLLIKLLPPEKRGTRRGIGFAIGSLLGVGMSALIPLIVNRIAFPYGYMVIFLLGLFFLFINVFVFLNMRQSNDVEPNEPMGLVEYLKQMPISLKESPKLRAMILTFMFLAMAHSLLAYYTLYAIRELSATEMHIATFTSLAIFSSAVAVIKTGFLADRYGPRITTTVAACLIIAAGTLALLTNSLNFLFVAWVLANISNSSFHMSAALMMGEVSPSGKLPLYVGVFTTISMAVSSIIVLVLAPILENLGFTPLFATVLMSGLLSLTINLFVLKKSLAKSDYV